MSRDENKQVLDNRETENEEVEIFEMSQPTDEEIYESIIEALHHNDQDRFREEFFKNHTYDQAQIYLTLDPAERVKLHDYLAPQELAEVYDIIDEDDHDRILTFLYDMDDKYAADVLSYMYTDNAVDILNELDVEKVRTYMHMMPKAAADDIKVLMHYADETVGSIMTTEFVSITTNQTVKSAMTMLRAKASNAETIYYLYVVDDDNRLVGVLSLRDLIVNDGNVMVLSLIHI